MKPFTAPLPRVLGWVWLGVVALLLVDLAARGEGRGSLIAAGALLLTAGADYVFWLRPRVVPGERGVRLVNPMRDTFVPWHRFTWADVTDVLRVHAGDQVFRSWPLRETKRARVRENLRRAEGLSDPELEETDPRKMRPVEFVARQLRDEAERRKARPLGEGGAGEAEPAPLEEPATAWAPDALVAIGVPVVLLLAVLVLL